MSEAKETDFFELISASHKKLDKQLNTIVISRFLEILRLAAVQLFLKRLENISSKIYKLIPHVDYDFHYDEHSCGPFIELFQPGKNKLLLLGLSEQEIEYLDDEIKAAIINQDEISKAIRIVNYQYEKNLRQWKEERDWSRYKDAVDFLEGLLDETVRKEVFGY